MKEAFQELLDRIDAVSGVVMLVDSEGRNLRCHQNLHIPREFLSKNYAVDAGNPYGTVALQKNTIETRAEIITPLVSEDKILGVLAVFCHNNHRFSESARTEVEQMAERMVAFRDRA